MGEAAQFPGNGEVVQLSFFVRLFHFTQSLHRKLAKPAISKTPGI
jgi:hypothetical protein